MKPVLKAPGTKRLKLKCDESLSNFAFKFNLRRYNAGPLVGDIVMWATGRVPNTDRPDLGLTDVGRGLHSSTSQLNLSRF